MTPEFVKWLTDRLTDLDSESDSAQEARLRAATETSLSPEQQMRWVEALADLVAEKWAATEPSGLATAQAAIAFLKTEDAESDHWWRQPPIEVDAVEDYLCIAIDQILEDEVDVAIEKAPSDQSHHAAADHDEEECAECLKQFALQAEHIDEVRGTITSMILRAHDLALASPANVSMEEP